MSLQRYALRRVLLGLIQIVAAAALLFALTEALPGDAAVALAGDNPDPALISQLRQQMGLDEPSVLRFARWAGGAVTGDLGTSLVSDRAVSALIGEHAVPSLILATLTLLLLVPLSVWLGVTAARREGGTVDRLITTVTLGLYSVPEFALAIVLVVVFAIGLGWFPPTAVGVDHNLLADPAVLVLPVLVLLARPICSLSRLVRAGMIESLASDYARHARRLGISPRRIIVAHALPNAIIPAVQQLARTADWLIAGVIVVEAVFVIPGLGTALVDAVSARDVPVIQGLAVLFAVTTVVLNLAADIASRALSPRAEVGR